MNVVEKRWITLSKSKGGSSALNAPWKSKKIWTWTVLVTVPASDPGHNNPVIKNFFEEV